MYLINNSSLVKKGTCSHLHTQVKEQGTKFKCLWAGLLLKHNVSQKPDLFWDVLLWKPYLWVWSLTSAVSAEKSHISTIMKQGKGEKPLPGQETWEALCWEGYYIRAATATCKVFTPLNQHIGLLLMRKQSSNTIAQNHFNGNISLCNNSAPQWRKTENTGGVLTTCNTPITAVGFVLNIYRWNRTVTDRTVEETLV